MSRSNKGEIKEVEKHDVAFNTVMEMFKSAPYYETFTERRTLILHATPVDKNATTYRFKYEGNGFGVLKTSAAHLQANFQITMNNNTAISNANGTAWVDNGGNAQPVSISAIVPPPLLLRTLWRSKDLKINEELVTIATNFEYLTSYIRFLTRDGTKADWGDSKRINLAIFDTPGAFDDIQHFNTDDAGCTNTGGRERYKEFRNNGGVMPTKKYMDEVDVMCFSESGNEIYLPSALKFELALNRAENKVVCMGDSRISNVATANGSSTALQDFSNMRINITDFEMHIPLYKPNDQLMTALNKLLGPDQEECKYYTTEFRISTTPLAAGKRNIQVTDVFGGSVPTRLFAAIIRQDNLNGTVPHVGGGDRVPGANRNNTNVFRFRWESITRCQVNINSVQWDQPIKDSKTAYWQLQRVLNREYRDMPFKYDDYETDFAIIAWDLTPGYVGPYQFLPIRSKGNVDVTYEFSVDTPASTILFIGEFRNQTKVGLLTPARKLFFN